MPYLRIQTNVKLSDIQNMDECLTELSAAVAKSVNKPLEYVMVAVIPDVAMIMGADAKYPIAHAIFRSIVGFGVKENKKHAVGLFPLIKKHFGVQQDRCYITFDENKASEVGLMGSTFHTIFQELGLEICVD